MPDEQEQQPKKRRGRPPKSPEAREKHAKRSAARRILQKLESCEDADELFTRIEELRAERTPAADPDIQRMYEGEVLEPGQRVGWPAPSKVAQFYPLAHQIWATVASETANSEVGQALRPRELVIETDGVRSVLRSDPIELLAQATAPVLAARVPEQATTPEAGLTIAVVSVLGLPALAMAGRLVSGWISSWWSTPPPPPIAGEQNPQPPQQINGVGVEVQA